MIGHEIEVKIPVPDARGAEARLESLGARVVHPPTLEDNRLYDREGGPLAAEGRLLRLRRRGGRCVLTAKAPPDDDVPGFKVRREEQVEVPDGDAVHRLLETAGFRETWRYQKVRSSWELDGAAITVDEIPSGCFLELEGEPERIDDVAGRLGFDRSAYVTETYREIHERWCQAQGVAVGDMMFPESAG